MTEEQRLIAAQCVADSVRAAADSKEPPAADALLALALSVAAALVAGFKFLDEGI